MRAILDKDSLSVEDHWQDAREIVKFFALADGVTQLLRSELEQLRKACLASSR
jgi:hypothetical protein